MKVPLVDKFALAMLDGIVVNRDTRQRRELPGIEELADSISRLGLINPIVITREGVLVAGERRLTACKQLGWMEIPVQYVDQLDPLHLHLIELEENIKRVDLTWQEETDAVAKYHELQKELNPGWAVTDTASSIGMTERFVRERLLVSEAIVDNLKGIASADTFSVARGLAKRARERMKASTLTTVIAPPIKVVSPEGEVRVVEATSAPKKDRRLSLLNDSFLTFESEMQFNFIHCDFPYGVSVGDTVGYSGAKFLGQYTDTPDVYFDLLYKLISAKFIAESAHLMFWFSMQHYSSTVEILQDNGWRVHPFPLIWHKTDNSGILADKDRWPRHIYETALMASRGDRKIVRAVSDTIGAPIALQHHTSEKPKRVLEHFFRMFVDSSTVMLDPTAGSANSLIVGESSGAQFSLGLELNEEFYKRALANIDTSG